MLAPLQETFMQRAIAEMTLIALAGGALGCWVVLYEFSYAAESLAHSIFPGLVIATLAGVPLLLGAAPAIVLAALAIALAGRVPGVGRDVAVAVVVTTMFGTGVLLALSPDSPPGIETLLFGDILGPGDADLIAAAALAVLVGAVAWLLHGRLLATGFDRASAGALGISPAAVEAALLVLLSAATVVAVQGLGNLLVVAVLVAPAAAARLWTRRVGAGFALAAAIGVGCGVGGLYLSYYVNVAAGAAIAGLLVGAFLVAAAARRVTVTAAG
jgi:ABC-type Mn2+/Zn2+ transport system permease subunit